jgi:hypothetical protein
VNACSSAAAAAAAAALQVSAAKPLQGSRPAGAYVTALAAASSLGIALLAAPRAGPQTLTLM